VLWVGQELGQANQVAGLDGNGVHKLMNFSVLLEMLVSYRLIWKSN
jgi:hypothetical protein